MMEEHFARDRAVWKLVLVNVCLIAIAVASCINAIVAFSLTVTCAATIIKIYKLDPEPFLLLTLHTTVSCMMLHDIPSTVFAITAVLVTCTTVFPMDVSLERMVVFLLSMAITSLQGTATAAIAAIVLAAAIAGMKLRPLRPAGISVLVLMLLATSVPFNRHVTAAMATMVAISLSGWFLLWRFKTKTEELYLDHVIGNNNNYDNGQINLMNGGHLKPYSATESLDLHGHTVTSALKTLHQFLREHENYFHKNRNGHPRYLKVITGEDGKNHAEDNMNLIKPTVANFLKINKYRYKTIPAGSGILQIDLESHVK